MACQEGNLEVLHALLEAGADKDLANQDGITALMFASSLGHLKILRLLLGAGADRNLVNNDGLTAVTLASQEGHVEVMRLLVDDQSLLPKKRRHGISGGISKKPR